MPTEIIRFGVITLLVIPAKLTFRQAILRDVNKEKAREDHSYMQTDFGGGQGQPAGQPAAQQSQPAAQGPAVTDSTRPSFSANAQRRGWHSQISTQ